MNEKNLQRAADENLFTIVRANLYPGRVVICGLNAAGDAIFQLVATMGRSKDSRNRRYKPRGTSGLVTEAADEKAMAGKDTTNIIYTAMCEVAIKVVGGHHESLHVASNGHQTEDVAKACSNGSSFYDAVGFWSYENDSIGTARITAASRWEDNIARAQMAICRRSPWGDDGCDRLISEFDQLIPGYGFCLTTYDKDGSPPPPFSGGPKVVPLAGTAEQILKMYWSEMYQPNRISMAVKTIPRDRSPASIIYENQYPKVA